MGSNARGGGRGVFGCSTPCLLIEERSVGLVLPSRSPSRVGVVLVQELSCLSGRQLCWQGGISVPGRLLSKTALKLRWLEMNV